MDQPYLIQEAMADFVGLLFGPAGGMQARRDEITRKSVTPDPSVLRLTLQTLDELDDDARQRACLAGWELARGVGFDQLPKRVLAGERPFEVD